jgi:hypothetical protein
VNPVLRVANCYALQLVFHADWSFAMNPEQLCKNYLAAMNDGSLDKILSLFDPAAVVVSPLYGTMPATAFFGELLADTNRSVTRLMHVFQSEAASKSVALHFHYAWTLKSGKVVEFECVDVFNLTSAGDKFTKLTIIYDTAPLRADFNETQALRP